MSSDNPNAAPPRVTIPIQRASGSAVLAAHSCRSAGGTPSRVVAAARPRPSAPWHLLHHAWYSAAGPESAGAWVASARRATTDGRSILDVSLVTVRCNEGLNSLIYQYQTESAPHRH